MAQSSRGSQANVFRPGEYRGIKPGQSTIDRVVNVLGEPTEKLQEIEVVAVYVYRNIESLDWVEVYYVHNNRKVDFVKLKLKSRITIKEAEAVYKLRLIRYYYNFGACLNSEGEMAVYETKESGDVEQLEDRSKGVVAEAHLDKVDGILFLSRPLGSKDSNCKPSSKKR